MRLIFWLTLFFSFSNLLAQQDLGSSGLDGTGAKDIFYSGNPTSVDTLIQRKTFEFDFCPKIRLRLCCGIGDKANTARIDSLRKVHAIEDSIYHAEEIKRCAAEKLAKLKLEEKKVDSLVTTVPFLMLGSACTGGGGLGDAGTELIFHTRDYVFEDDPPGPEGMYDDELGLWNEHWVSKKVDKQWSQPTLIFVESRGEGTSIDSTFVDWVDHSEGSEDVISKDDQLLIYPVRRSLDNRHPYGAEDIYKYVNYETDFSGYDSTKKSFVQEQSEYYGSL